MKNKINLQKGFIIPLIIVILALLAIGGGVYAYHEKKVAEVATNEEMNMMATS
jgi:hypothetical protein